MKYKDMIIREIQNIQYSVETLENKIKGILEEYAKNTCPFKVDDIVEICGCYHVGKKGIVKYVEAFYSEKDSTIYWKVDGNVFDSEGNTSSYLFYFTEKDYAEYLKEKSNDDKK